MRSRNRAERRLRQDGPAGLHEWLVERQREAPLPPLLVVDASGREIMGRPVPPGIRLFLRPDQGSEFSDERGRHMRERFRRSVRTFHDVEGNQFVMLIPRFEPRAGGWFAAPRARAVFPIALVLISGVVCLFLARYLTRPIATFRRAGRRIAAGDLDARVGPEVARRKDEFGDLARDFDDMAARVEQLVATQQRLLRDVSHELRSPLARLQAAAGLIRQRGGDDTNLDRIEREIEVLNELIGQVLGFSRLQGRTSLEVERTDLVELVQGVVEDARFEGAAEGRQVEFMPGAPVSANIDAGLVRSAVENVIRNALQYSARMTVVAVEADRATGGVVIRVSDDGRGVAEADLAKLFEPFFTGQSAQAGGGIGLAIARRAVELHGGTIGACNAAAGGLVVTIRMPAGAAG